MQNKISETLIDKGYELLQKEAEDITFTNIPEANSLLNNLKKYPHLFVLACIMDKQIKAERAWKIPYKIGLHLKGFEFKYFEKLTRQQILQIFENETLHRFNKNMAEQFYLGIQQIKNNYSGDSSKIWTTKKDAAAIVYNFLEFKGVGPKISTMAVNILRRHYNLDISNLSAIDISPDVHVVRVFRRTGLVSENSEREAVIYKAKELHHKYPGVFDSPVFNIGRNWCKPRKPLCGDCYLEKYCPKNITKHKD